MPGVPPFKTVIEGWSDDLGDGANQIEELRAYLRRRRVERHRAQNDGAAETSLGRAPLTSTQLTKAVAATKVADDVGRDGMVDELGEKENRLPTRAERLTKAAGGDIDAGIIDLCELGDEVDVRKTAELVKATSVASGAEQAIVSQPPADSDAEAELFESILGDDRHYSLARETVPAARDNATPQRPPLRQRHLRRAATALSWMMRAAAPPKNDAERDSRAVAARRSLTPTGGETDTRCLPSVTPVTGARLGDGAAKAEAAAVKSVLEVSVVDPNEAASPAGGATRTTAPATDDADDREETHSGHGALDRLESAFLASADEAEMERLCAQIEQTKAAIAVCDAELAGTTEVPAAGGARQPQPPAFKPVVAPAKMAVNAFPALPLQPAFDSDDAFERACERAAAEYAGDVYPWSAQLHRNNQQVFGNSGFRTNQKEAINAAMSGRDVFVLMPTGGGALAATADTMRGALRFHLGCRVQRAVARFTQLRTHDAHHLRHAGEDEPVGCVPVGGGFAGVAPAVAAFCHRRSALRQSVGPRFPSRLQTPLAVQTALPASAADGADGHRIARSARGRQGATEHHALRHLQAELQPRQHPLRSLPEGHARQEHSGAGGCDSARLFARRLRHRVLSEQAGVRGGGRRPPPQSRHRRRTLSRRPERCGAGGGAVALDAPRHPRHRGHHRVWHGYRQARCALRDSLHHAEEHRGLLSGERPRRPRRPAVSLDPALLARRPAPPAEHAGAQCQRRRARGGPAAEGGGATHGRLVSGRRHLSAGDHFGALRGAFRPARMQRHLRQLC
eukprot:ctg_2998.g614